MCTHRKYIPELSDPRLTVREAQVLALVREGHHTKTIAGLLGIFPETVKSHIKNARRKTNAER